jgi:putative ABC transport system ATP-binding protein
MSNPLIKITNIKRDFVLGNEIIYVLKGIDLEINKGICSADGTFWFRKSTLMNLLGCLDTPRLEHIFLMAKMSVSKNDD